MITDHSFMCDCPANLVNTWFRNGRAVECREIADNTGAVDADEFTRSGCDSWMISCPQCGRIYAEAVAQ